MTNIAYRQGFNAYLGGLLRSDCPYWQSRDESNYNDWIRGWNDAKNNSLVTERVTF